MHYCTGFEQPDQNMIETEKIKHANDCVLKTETPVEMFQYLNLLLFTAKLYLFLTGLIALKHPGQPRIKKNIHFKKIKSFRTITIYAYTIISIFSFYF